MTTWVSPTSSKKRSNTMVSSVGSVPSAAWPAARYWASCEAATASSCFSSRSHASSAFRPAVGELPERVLAQARDRRGELVAPRRRLADPERQRRRHAAGVLDEDLVHLDLLHAVRGVAELEDVAGHALEREVLADRADAEALGVQHDVVVELVRDHAGVGHGREPRAFPRAQPPVDRVVVQVGRAPAAPGRVALGEHLQDLLEFLRGQVRVGLRAAEGVEQLVHAPFAAGDFRRRSAARARRAASAARGSCRARRAARCRAGRCTRRGRRARAGTAAPSGSRRSHAPRGRRAGGSAEISRGEPIWQTRSMSPMSMPSSSDEVAISAFSSPAFSRVSALRRCSFDRLPWWQATCSAPMRSARKRVARSARRRLLTKMSVVRCARISSASRSYSSSQTSFAMMASSGERGSSSARSRSRTWPVSTISTSALAVADQEARHVLERLDRRGEPDAHRRLAAERIEPLEREHQVRAALAARDRVQLVHDHALDALQHRAAGFRGQQDEERLRRRDQDVRRGLAHAVALEGRGVAGAHRVADRHVVDALLEELVADAGERLLEVLLDVVRERLQRRHIEDVHLVRQALRTGPRPPGH